MSRAAWIWLRGLLLVFCFGLFFPTQIFAEEAIYQNEEEAYQKRVTELNGKPGVYLVTLKYREQGEVVEKEVYVTVLGDHTVQIGGVAINANPVAISVDQVGKLTQEDWISMTSAQAWDTKTGESVGILAVDAGQVEAKVGNSYPVIFTTINQVKTTVQVSVVAEKAAQEWLDWYEQNQQVNHFETEQQNGQISWGNFEHVLVVFFQFLFLMLLFVPILALILQYGFAQKLVKQVIDLVIKE